MVVLLCLALAGGTWWLRHAIRASLPQLDGTLTVAGLSAPVTVRRDQHGVPHIEAATLTDMLVAQGYVTAQDRLWQMDMIRRASGGELAELLGSKVLEHDRMQRVLLFRRTAERLAATLPAEEHAQLEAYARGVNAFIAASEAAGTLPAEFKLLGYQPRQWTPTDSMLVALSMVQMLDERWHDKLTREQVTRRLGPTLAADLYPVGSWRDHPPVPSGPAITDPQPEIPDVPLDETQTRLRVPLDETQTKLGRPDLLALNQLIEATRGRCSDCAPGSNEWAVSGAHTASGKPLLSNDMHLGHNIPDIWYESDLHAGDYHAAGTTVPGLPFILVGHNAHIAWGYTALYGDTQDVYIEQVDGRGHYLTPGGWQPLRHASETIHVRGGADVTLDVESSDHGPIVTPLLPGETRALAMKWSVYQPQVSGLPIYALNTASDWAGFRNALQNWWAPTLNVIYADDQGHIGYQAVGYIPIRDGGLQAVPVRAQSSGGTGSANDREWTGYVPFDAMPSTLDPAGGLIATANSRVTPDGYPYQLTLEWASPYRNERIWKQLAGRSGLTSEDMIGLQTDVVSPVDQAIGQRFAYAIDHASRTSAKQRAAADLLRSWDGSMKPESAAAAVLTAAKTAFWPAVLRPKIGEDWQLYSWGESEFAREEMIMHEPAAWLPSEYKSWDDFLAAVLAQGLEDAHAPGNLAKWSYGDIHRIQIEHPLYSLLPGFKHASGIGPLPLGGDATTVQQSKGGLGPSQRFTIDWASPDSATENIVMGQSGNPDSAYYRDQWPNWYRGTTFALPFTDAAVAGAAKHTLRLVP
jgi:penicillin amidase